MHRTAFYEEIEEAQISILGHEDWRLCGQLLSYLSTKNTHTHYCGSEHGELRLRRDHNVEYYQTSQRMQQEGIGNNH